MTALHYRSRIRAVERAALATLPEGVLMRRAAQAVADETVRRLRRRPRGAPVIALVGPGNNGGDALLAALLLHERGFPVQAWLLDRSTPVSRDAARVREQAVGAGFLLGEREPACIVSDGLILDGLFGTGLARPLIGVAKQWVDALSVSGAEVVSVDVPSGLDTDTGAPVGGAEGCAVRAACTVTMIADKPGLHTGAGPEFGGEILVADLSVSMEGRDGTLIGMDEARALAAPLRRAKTSHKGRHGSVRVVGGAEGMQGAVLLAATGAQRAGAGKVFVAALATSLRIPSLDAQLMRARPLDQAAGLSAVVVGCGLGLSQKAHEVLRRLLELALPLVIDADGLNLLAREAGSDRTLRRRLASTVLTPHPLEAARLLGSSTTQVESDRIGAARRLADQFGSMIVLKGAGSICATPGGHWAIVGAGDPALATAGTGDVLAGVIGGLIAQGLGAAHAACLGAWAHAEGGSIWANRHGGSIGLAAQTLPDCIRDCLNRLAYHDRHATDATSPIARGHL